MSSSSVYISKSKYMTTERGANNQLSKNYQLRSKKKLHRKSLVQQAKQEREDKDAGNHLTLNERFNMFEETAGLKRLCPNVEQEYSAYQPMTDLIYTRWERTRPLEVIGLQQNPTLLLDKESNNNNQPKSKVGLSIESLMNFCSDDELLKRPTSNVYTISPLLLRKDIAAIVTDNVVLDGISTLTKNTGKNCNTTTLLTDKEELSKRRNRTVARKGANITKAKSNEKLFPSDPWCSLNPGLSVWEKGSQFPASFDLCPTVDFSTPGMWTTNIFLDKRKIWNRNETVIKNLKTTKGLPLRKMNLSILSPTFIRDSKNQKFTKSIVLKIIPDEMDSSELSLKKSAEIQRNQTSRISL